MKDEPEKMQVQEADNVKEAASALMTLSVLQGKFTETGTF